MLFPSVILILEFLIRDEKTSIASSRESHISSVTASWQVMVGLNELRILISCFVMVIFSQY